MKVSDSLVNVPNELSQLGTDRPVTDQLLELLEWLFATKNFLSPLRGTCVGHDGGGGEKVGEGRHGAHDETPLEGDGHDAVHDEGDVDEVPGSVETSSLDADVEDSLKL